MVEVSVYNLSLERQGILPSFVSMVWEEGYNTEGVFQLECSLTEDNLALLQLEWYCGVTDHDTLMVIKSVQIEDNKIVVNGYPATHIFHDRVSVATVSNMVAAYAIYELFEVMDPYPCFTLPDDAWDTEVLDEFTAQTSDGTLQEYFETICQGCELGFRMVHDKSSKELQLVVYKGEENANAKFSTKYGNMGDITYTISSVDYKNVAVVAGAGSGDDRVTVYAGATDTTGSDRREMYIDARQEQPDEDETDEEYEAELIAYGEGKLIEQAQIESIGFEINDDSVSLGDVVFCYIPELGINAKIRVAAITETYQNNAVLREVTLGTPIILRRY